MQDVGVATSGVALSLYSHVMLGVRLHAPARSCWQLPQANEHD